MQTWECLRDYSAARAKEVCAAGRMLFPLEKWAANSRFRVGLVRDFGRSLVRAADEECPFNFGSRHAPQSADEVS